MKIQFESSTVCNSNCTFCPRSKMTRPHGEMSDELFHKIIKEGKEIHKSFFVPFLNGEPFMFPRIWEWLDYMQEQNVKVHLYTNAERMNVSKLIKYTNISLVCCSVNATTAATHKKIMRTLDFKKVKNNVKNLIKKAPFRVFVSMVEVDVNKHEVEKFKKAWGEHAIFGEFKNWGGAVHDKIEKTGDRVPCWSLLNSMNILWDGRVVPCCLDYDGQQIIGDVNKNTLTEIWHQSHWIRKLHRRGDYSMIPCKDCNQNILNAKSINVY
jgi:radical SAM protein with 4Fe4S-binding SPASM domain